MEREKFLDYLSSYANISMFIKTYSVDEITQIVASFFGISTDVLSAHPMGGYSKGGTSGAYYFVIRDLKKNIKHYDWVYEHMGDDTSRDVFLNLIRFRVAPVTQFIKDAYDSEYPEYFDDNLVFVDENEVFVDCGGYIGDTTEIFIKKYKAYKHIYLYEPSDDNFEFCCENLREYRNVTIRRCGVGERSEHIGLNVAGASSSFINPNNQDTNLCENQVEIAALDTDIQEPVTFIKMDIEGFEIPALLGAKEHIMNEKPKLAICLYHMISDIWEIPRLIHYMNPEYKLYIRHYDSEHNWETVLYAIPEKEEQRLSRGGVER